MARTKQTARKSTGGCAPRRQLATKAARDVKTYFRSQQSAGSQASRSWTAASSRATGADRRNRKIFVNCENTFGEFKFNRVATRDRFSPVLSLGRISTPSFSQDNGYPRREELLMRVDFSSVLDGNEQLIESSREPLDAVFVIDISGSMNSSFVDDIDRRSKFAVAVECISQILKKLSSSDRTAIITFNTSAEVICPLAAATETSKKSTLKKLNSISVGGGTDLANGLSTGYAHMREASGTILDDSEPRTQRVFFLTDMQSSQLDEDKVLKLAADEASLAGWLAKKNKDNTETESATGSLSTPLLQCAQAVGKRKAVEVLSPLPSPALKKKKQVLTSPVFLNLIGIGVDLSVSTVESISSIPGAKYVSVISAAELQETVAADFSYDITPLAFNIKISLPDGLKILKVYGSAELNNLRRNSKSAVISAEFPVPLDDLQQSNGGVYLFHLNDSGVRGGTEARINFSWLNSCGIPEATDCIIHIPHALPSGLSESRGCDLGLMKARVLVEYVDQLTQYMLEEDNEQDLSADMETRVELTFESRREINIAVKKLKDETLTRTEIPDSVPEKIKKHFQNAKKFQQLKRYVFSEIEDCGDTTLGTTNKNIADTLNQIIECEIFEITSYLESVTPLTDVKDVPRGMMCPITLTLMTDPVMAADGHSYERSAIADWFLNHIPLVSPLTNLPLPNNSLIPNHSLKSAIEEYKAKSERDSA